MLDGSVGVVEFLLGLPKRLDGQLLITASTFSAFLLLANIFPEVATTFGLASTGKWIALWATWPFILFVVHLRLRSLFDHDGLIAVICHGLAMFGSIIYFGLKNFGVI